MPVVHHGIEALTTLIRNSRNLVVLTGAGCSTESGIPDYRDVDGEWKQSRPVQFQDFVDRYSTRQRYWARSMIGWQRVADAQPNRAHLALARLQQAGLVWRLITQNIDGLHQQAGSEDVIDLHGRLATVICLECGYSEPRETMQQKLGLLNPDWHHHDATPVADGDAQLETDFSSFQVPDCENCHGLLKPDVVFFGETVPVDRVVQSKQAIANADALLVAGSSLMVWSGLRFVRAASERGIPIALINLGKTRADELFTHRITQACGDTLTEIAGKLLGDWSGELTSPIAPAPHTV